MNSSINDLKAVYYHYTINSKYINFENNYKRTQRDNWQVTFKGNNPCDDTFHSFLQPRKKIRLPRLKPAKKTLYKEKNAKISEQTEKGEKKSHKYTHRHTIGYINKTPSTKH